MKGLVLKSTGKWYEVKAEDGQVYSCQIRGKLRLKGSTTTNPVAAGDHVTIERDERGDINITEIEARRNYIIRRSVNLSKEAQIVASNIDQAFLLVTVVRPQTTPGFVDRFLVTAEAYGVRTVLLFHKFDQYSDEEREKALSMKSMYEEVGYTCLVTSLQTGQGIEELGAMLRDRVSLFSGHSGTGKSSLVNHFIPGKDLRIGEISSSSNKGQHTTTFSEMHELPIGGFIVDTPGIKGFGLVDIPREELHHHFIEFFRLLPECKYNNCLHINEPGCAVIRGLEEGAIAESRYSSYLSMYHDEEGRSPYR